MHHRISRISSIVLALGALALTPVASLAADVDQLRDASVKAGAAGSAEAEQTDNLTYEALYERLFGTRYPSTEQIAFVEANIWEVEETATFAAVEPRDVLGEIKRLFGVEHVTTDMIQFYEANVWEMSAGAGEVDNSYPRNHRAGRFVE